MQQHVGDRRFSLPRLTDQGSETSSTRGGHRSPTNAPARSGSPESIASTGDYVSGDPLISSSLSTSAGQYQPPQRPVDLAAIKKLAVEVIPNKLYFASLSFHPTSTQTTRFFTVDYDLAYEPYFADFGPLNLAMLVRFCRALRGHVHAVAHEDNAEIIFYSSHTPHLRANAGYLIAGFAVLVLNMTPSNVMDLMDTAYPKLLPFRDASYGVAAFPLTVSDIVAALHKAKLLGWIDVDTFDVEDYELHDQIAHGDMNWIVPGKILGFSSPVDAIAGREAKTVIQPFKKRGVRLIIRLNEKLYDRRTFTEVGMRHEELPFPDGSTPSDAIVRQFLEWCEAQQGAIAVHCKAGLGRTGTLVGVFVMKHYGLSAREFIAWCRMCRPGSVIGGQQQYLETMQRRLDAAGDVYRRAAMGFHPHTATASSLSSSSLHQLSATQTSVMGATLTSVQRPTTVASRPESRAKSPDTRLRPKPVLMVEQLPYDVPYAATKKRIVRLQQEVSSTVDLNAPKAGKASFRRSKAAETAMNLAESGLEVDAFNATMQSTKGIVKAAVAGNGLTRPLLPPLPATYIAGVAEPDRAELLRALL